MHDYSISLYMRHISKKDRIYQWVISFILLSLYKTNTAQKESVFGVILVRIFPAFSRIRTKYGESVFSPNVGKCGKNADQNKSELWLFLRSARCFEIFINNLSISILFIQFMKSVNFFHWNPEDVSLFKVWHC